MSVIDVTPDVTIKIEIGGGSVDTEKLSTATNLLNGEAEGSLRSVNAKPESEDYKLGRDAVALGVNTRASKNTAFAVGRATQANGESAFAEGQATVASGDFSHAEGYMTQSSGESGHAEGEYSVASGKCSHAEGYDTDAGSESQHVQGKYNIYDRNGKYAHIVGNGEKGNRSNAHTLDWNGNAWFAGDVIVGGKSQDDADAKVLATQEYVDTKVGGIKIPEVPSLEGYATKQYVDDKIDEIDIPEMPEIPAALPNPNALTFSGAANGSYDGSAPLTVNIPDGVKSWNDLEDKPFGNVVEDGYIIPEKTVAVDMGDDGDLQGFLITEKPNAPLVVGNTYTVRWNGADYNCVAFESDAEGFEGAVLLGNTALVNGEYSEEPFIISIGEQDMDGVMVYGMGLVLDGSDTVAFSIYGEMEYTKKIAEEFLPEDYINSLIDAKIAAIPNAEEASF